MVATCRISADHRSQRYQQQRPVMLLSTTLLRKLAELAHRALEILMRLLGIPFSLAGGILGGGGGAAPAHDDESLEALEARAKRAEAALSQFESKLRPDGELVAARRRNAHVAWRWAAGSLLARETLPVPAGLPRTVKPWLRGLDYASLQKLAAAQAEDVMRHISGERLIDGLPAVADLPPVSVVYPKPADDEDESAPRISYGAQR
ncbi:hypothetical protein [Rhodopseudomonas palustris]|uniref:hypothetical protein n=1 Tax=Rhodopseudomonas palustris TaxID=1076 RepID=UPI0021F2E3E0|nr:hypothetical protein [Rhodopseudomonas palustris]UYO55195.1 hypothetical protein KQX61_07270 [Rhodopseudomonas palustris]